MQPYATTDSVFAVIRKLITLEVHSYRRHLLRHLDDNDASRISHARKAIDGVLCNM